MFSLEEGFPFVAAVVTDPVPLSHQPGHYPTLQEFGSHTCNQTSSTTLSVCEKEIGEIDLKV